MPRRELAADLMQPKQFSSLPSNSRSKMPIRVALRMMVEGARVFPPFTDVKWGFVIDSQGKAT